MSDLWPNTAAVIDNGPDKFRTLTDNLPTASPGAYGVHCLVNAKWYIGISFDVVKRRSEHELAADKRSRLAKAVRKHGRSSFVFIPLYRSFTSDHKVMQPIETDLILTYKSHLEGYNQVIRLFGAYGAGYGPIHQAACVAAQNTPDALERKSRHGKRLAASHPKTIEVLAAGRLLGTAASLATAAERYSDPVWEGARIAAIKAAHERPEVKANVTLANRQTHSTPEYQANHAAAMASAEVRAKISAAVIPTMQQGWAKRRALYGPSGGNENGGKNLQTPENKAKSADARRACGMYERKRLPKETRQPQLPILEDV